MKKKYILFDHDGVLVDTEYWYFMSNKRALSELGICLDMESYLVMMSHGISCWKEVSNQGIDKAEISRQKDIRNNYYQEYLKNENIEISGVENVLVKLSEKYRMAIITTSKRNDFEIIHKQRRITDYMDFVLTVADYDKAKPCPDPYLAGLKRFDASTEEALVVEDSGRGLKSAVAAGIDCVIVHNEFTQTHDFSKATCRISSLDELIGLLEEN